MTKHHGTATDWRAGSKRRMIAELAELGRTKRETYAALRPMVEGQSAPMIFSANVNGRRTPKPISLQLVELKNEIGRVFALLGRAESAAWESAETEPNEIPDAEDETENEEDDETEETKSPKAIGKDRVNSELDHFLREVRRIRTLCERRAETGAALDSISMRPAQAAGRLIPAGIPAAALLHSMLLHWSPEIRRSDAGVPDFDYTALSAEIMRDRGIDSAGRHELFGYVLTLAEERQPVMLIGPAGTGKSRLCKQVSEYLEIPYGETPMTPGATRGDLLGRMTANPNEPFILSQFAEIYSGGGVFNFEEIDAADPGMLLVLNNALAGDELFNSANGQRYGRNADFVAMATANTFGIGANREFTGREKLDAATIDRWRMGRVFLPLDETIEEGLLYGTL
jgi:hypothetical protein